MKNFLFLSLIFTLAGLFSCSLVFDDAKIEGKWWMSKDVSSSNTTIFDSKDKSTYVAEFKSDRTFNAINPITGDQTNGRWTIDTYGKFVSIYYTAPSASAITVNYDFPDYNKLKLINPSNASYYMELTRN